MTSQPSQTSETTWKFSHAFWIVNGVELLERAAWYGVFVAITLYLSRILGFTDIEAGVVTGDNRQCRLRDLSVSRLLRAQGGR